MEPIAVIGLACRFPGARDHQEFWQNLVAGRESITFFTRDELRTAGVPQARIDDPEYVTARPLVAAPEYFDAALFGLTSREAELCDPQIRMLLEVCHAATENAGYDPFALRDAVGVFAAVGRNDYFTRHLRANPERLGGAGSAHLVQTLNDPDYAATTVSYRLNLAGPSMTVNTACSSALAAVHLACQALRYGECEAALAGASVIESPLVKGHTWVPGSVLSPDGHCRPFSADAAGTIFGSGVGVVLLKRMSDALAAGDHIQAVIRASAVNNDGADKISFSAPSVTGQAAVIGEAMALAGARPAEVGYVEAHATGTALGDPVEIAALNEAYQVLTDAPLSPRSTLVGSVKANIGHLNQAAGIAGLIKTILVLQHEAIPPTIGVGTVNPQLALDRTPFAIGTELQPWPREAGRSRLAAVTSLGIGGTNVHTVLQEGPVPRHAPADGDFRVIAWSARSPQAREQARRSLAGFFATEPPFADAAATLLHGRTPHACRAITVCTSASAAAAALAATGTSKVITGDARPGLSVGLLFPGQGAHRPLMAAGLYGQDRSFSIAVDECLEAFERQDLKLADAWLNPGPAEPGPLEIQPLLFAVEYALAMMWMNCGLRPTAVLGHSVGELAAAAVAGVFTLADAVRVVAARARAMREHPVPGGMIAVSGPESAVAGLLSCRLTVAAVNAPRQTVVSGPNADLEELAGRLAGTGLIARRLEVTHAFHHPRWAVAEEYFRTAFAGVTLAEPRIPLLSGATGAPVSAAEAVNPEFWVTQLSRTVLFLPALRAMADGHFTARPGILLECGPGRTLSQLARPVAAESVDVSVVSTLPGEGDDRARVLEAAGRLWTLGASIDWAALGQHEPQVRLPVPGYPYQRERHWVDPAGPGEAAGAGSADGRPADGRAPGGGAQTLALPSASAAPARPEPDLGAAPLSRIEWTPAADRAPQPGLAGTVLALLPADGAAAAAVLRAVQRTGTRVIRILPGEEYVAGDDYFGVRLGTSADFSQAWQTLRDRGIQPDLLVHGASAGSPGTGNADVADRLAASYYSLRAMAKAAALLPASHRVRLLVLTSRSVDVTGGERVEPLNAVVHGLLRTALTETPHLTGCVIDIGDKVPATVLATEIGGPDRRGGVVALRGRRRWVAAERPVPVPAAASDALRENGVYLITGGLGGLGLVLARRLAATGLCPRLILLGRRGPDDRREAIEELTALGAEVHAAACDITDLAALRVELTAVAHRFGAVNGVFHLAGKAGKHMIAFHDDAGASEVLAPKVIGALNLEEAFADAPRLDFVVYYSSRAATDGLVGGGDYAAANAFLDAQAGESRLAGGRVLSVGWPVFSGVGMAADSGHDISGLARRVADISLGSGSALDGRKSRQAAAPAETEGITWETDLHAATYWVLDEHRLNRVPLLPGTAYLDLVIRAFRDRVAPPGDGAIALDDVVFLAPFHYPKARRMRLTFTPSAAAHKFTAASRPADDASASWTVHATGRVARSAPLDQPIVDLTALRARFEAAGGGPAGNAVKSAFTLGPRWRNVTRQWTTAQERLVAVELPAPFRADLPGHALHHALLDTVTAAIRGPGQGATVPFLYRRLVHRADLPAEFFGHVRTAEAASPGTIVGDLDLIDTEGNILVSIEGFTMRETELAPPPAAEAGPSVAPDARPSGEAPRAPADGLDPVAGTMLLMALLAGGASGHVVVRPHRGGAPVPVGPAGLPQLAREGLLPSDAAASAAPPPRQPSASPALPEPLVAGGMEERLRSVWAEVLGTTSVTDDQDFFEAGGHSLTAIEIMAKVRQLFGVELSIGFLLDTRTFGGLVQALREQGVS